MFKSNAAIVFTFIFQDAYLNVFEFVFVKVLFLLNALILNYL